MTGSRADKCFHRAARKLFNVPQFSVGRSETLSARNNKLSRGFLHHADLQMLPHLSDQRRHDRGFQISNIRKLIVLKLSAGNYKLIVIFSCTFFVVVVVCLQAVRLRRPLRAARHLRTSSGTAQQWGECEDVLHHVSQSFVFLNDSHSCVCSWTTRWGRSITSSVSWWTVWSRWTCIAASTSSSWETTVRPPYTLRRFVFPLVRYG